MIIKYQPYAKRFLTILVCATLLSGCVSAPSSDATKEVDTQFQAENLERHLVIQDAIHFIDTIDARRQLAAAKSTRVGRWWSKNKEEKRLHKQVLELEDCADSAAKVGHISQQKMCLRLLTLIAPDLERRRDELAGIVALEEKREKISLTPKDSSVDQPKKEKSLSPNSRSSSRIGSEEKNRLAKEFNDAIIAEDVKLAQTIINGPYSKTLSAEEQQRAEFRLKKLKEEKVQEGLRLGQYYYSQGNLNRALTVWQNTRELDPDNLNLQKNIQRVEVFIENLKQIRKLNQSVEL